MARTSKTDWLNAGLQVLTAQGEGGLTVDGLVTFMGLTKGSFYHHFPSLGAYRTALLAHLDHVGFADVVDTIDPALPPAAQLQFLTDLISRRNPAEDRAVRLWAERDPGARALVQRVDERRLAYLAGLFTAIVGDPAQGRQLARLGYAVYLGAAQMHPPIQGEEYRQLGELLHRQLLGGAPPRP
ncbi:TetR/AcrR family transcriptional regulator [Deinococcus multiflagellatus]|uniref:TetR/AcrR family transcriptional regulator n=1 Tax=Deinococcus multiflagellatus TaxID=1656887 RepID=UPI001CCC6D81|nr:TetR/AcrR family transcriptional regulator [Deinococcus multiflagellatus]MBZ9712628.1 TetR/AcrR family transcriptional regulator [Deinococcus multiflagellatus]